MKAQLELNYIKAAEERDAGIEQAVSHANEVDPGWSDRAFQMLKDWLKGWPKGYRFMMENFRQIAQIRGLPDPPHFRAYGAISLRAKNAGLIKSNGRKPTASVKNHGAWANEWEKV